MFKFVEGGWGLPHLEYYYLESPKASTFAVFLSQQQSVAVKLHLTLAELTQGGNSLILLTGSVFLVSGAKSYQYDVRRNRLLNVMSTHSWSGC